MSRLIGCILCLVGMDRHATGAAPQAVTDRVIALTEDQTLTLEHSGKARLMDIVFPDAALANGWLAAHMLQQPVVMLPYDEDRYGRTRVMAEVEEEAMLREGIAVLFNQGPIPPSWIHAEAAARVAKLGVWADAGFVRTPESVAPEWSSFQVVEGVVTHVHAGKSVTYINFGADWRTDFSVNIAGRARKAFAPVLIRVQPGTRVRVRGAVYPENGPMIRLTQPEQLEIVGN